MHHIVPKFKSLPAASSLEACFMNSICVRRRLSHTFRMCKFLRTLLRPRISRSRVIWLTTGEIHTKHKFCPHDTYLKSLTERTGFFSRKTDLEYQRIGEVNTLFTRRGNRYTSVADFFFPMASHSASRKKAGNAYVSRHNYNSAVEWLWPKSVVRRSALDLIQIAKSSSLDKRISKLGAPERQKAAEKSISAAVGGSVLQV